LSSLQLIITLSRHPAYTPGRAIRRRLGVEPRPGASSRHLPPRHLYPVHPSKYRGGLQGYLLNAAVPHGVDLLLDHTP
jgi:hypothetical protein